MTTNVSGEIDYLPCVAGPTAEVEAGPASPRLRPPRTVLPALLSSALLYACYFPLALGWLGWVALVPLLVLVRSAATPRRIGLSAYLGGLAFFGPVLQWLRVADFRMYFTWVALTLYCALYFPVAVGLLRLLDRRTRLPLVLTLPVVWTALEYLRAFVMTGFSWYYLGHTQHDFLMAAQVADLGGAYAVSFVVAAVNALIFECLFRSSRFRQFFRLPGPPSHGRMTLLAQSAAVQLLLAATLAYGAWRLTQTEFTPGPVVALIQSNLDQRIRNDVTDYSARQIFTHHRELTYYACTQDPRPDLIVWPETSLPGEWHENARGEPLLKSAEPREAVVLVRQSWKANVLFGVAGRVSEEDGRSMAYNSAVLVGRDGQRLRRYDKMHRVPFGEFVPLKDWFPWMANFAPYDSDYGVDAGRQWTRFDMGPYRFGVVICYEDTDPNLAREYARPDGNERPVDFLVNISNDGWFDGSSEHEEHLAICRFRAIECRRAVARAVNMGISAVIDGNGRICLPDRGYMTVDHGNGISWNWKNPKETPRDDEVPRGGDVPVRRWPQFMKAAGVLLTAIPIDDRVSVYARWGDWLAQGCWLVLGWATFVAWRRPVSNGARLIDC